MCGPAGSGKSTVARELEAKGMTRLSFDREAWRRGIHVMPLPAEVHEEIERELRARLIALVKRGGDVVLDFSFWSRRSRRAYRDLLRPLEVIEILGCEVRSECVVVRVLMTACSHPFKHDCSWRREVDRFGHHSERSQQVTIRATGSS